jgi:galactokinase
MTARPVSREQRVEELIAAFERQFGRRPQGIAEAPGRVNLIGEHVDYNDGLVLPFAIHRSVMCAWTGADADELTLQENLTQHIDASLRLLIWSVEYDGWTAHRIQDLNARSLALRSDYEFAQAVGVDVAQDWYWMDYVDGVARTLHVSGLKLGQFAGAITGNIPQGAGLSSSAALEVAFAGALRDAFALEIDDGDLARLCQRAENEYVGVQCGIMDQFASALSKRGHALLIDCRTLAYEHVPLRLAEAGLCVVIANSGVKRELASSAYNERRRECEEAVALLRERLGRLELRSLRDVTQAEMDALEIDSVPLQRARHVVSEIGRVAAAVEELRHDDFDALGRLMGESHRSLREDYEVSSPELDLLVGLATAQEYVLGARLTGAGFGGCTVNLVRTETVDAFERDVMAAYRERTGLAAEMYVTEPSDGLRTWRV